MHFTLLRRNKYHTILAWNCFQYIYRFKLGPYSEAKQLCEFCRAMLYLAPQPGAMVGQNNNSLRQRTGEESRQHGV